jgi:uncharacterized membrane protein
MPFFDHDLPLSKEQLTFSERVLRHLRRTFTKGLFVVIPLGITIFILKFLFNLADGVLGPHLASIYSLITHHPGYIPGLGMLSGVIVIYLAGLAAGNIMGNTFFQWADSMLARIPVVKSVYTSSKQLTQVFREGRSAYSRAVFVEWPRKGVRAIGFVTAEVIHDGELFIVVYVPTMPNPTSGFALYFRPEEVYECGMTVEDAVKFVVSGGVVVH